jgi:hypothetical protein
MPVSKEATKKQDATTFDGPEDEEGTVVRNPNYVRDLVFISLALGECTKIPILFMGNPGIAKTTGVRLWAEMNNYKVTTLIGTQRVAEEILGYMVNDASDKRLITYTPDWYDEIIENKKAGFKTLLFIDELSQAPDNVQGAMLQLIFDRRVGGRANYLPEDTLVVSAANYKGNIPPQCGIQAPTLNRFAIVNVEPQDGIGLVTEFLQTEEERKMNIPSFQFAEITPSIQSSIYKNLKSALINLFSVYSKKDEQDTILDFKNQNFCDIFDRPGPVYNFMTGRTISYLYRMMEGMIHLGIVRKEYKAVVINIFLGLAGLGTNSFKNSEDELEGDFSTFKVKLISRLQAALRRAVEENMNEINSTEINYKGKPLDKNIADWLRYSDTSSGNIYDKNLVRLMDIIKEAYPTDTNGMEKVISKWDNSRMLNDLQKIKTLLDNLKAYPMVELEGNIKTLSIIKEAYEGYLTVARDELI